MSTAPLENAPTIVGARFTKIYDKYGKHIITRDEHTELEWQPHVMARCTNFIGIFCGPARLCRESRVGGYTDWRAPTREEALSVAPMNAYWYWDEECPWVWTSTPDDEAPEKMAWVVKFGSIHPVKELRSNRHHVRAVRGQMRTDITATPKAGES
ncbi:hypothetical protein XFUD_02045 [Xylella fastidiosa]|uniref:Lcl C-terminal domain-containing protein n=1 Tax=Xylella fastidiosa (strain 9a5c) TaxID=160492 RepID=Q9PG11_XYLFA|nr:DUF1566 domain-containing protein [Xylella fastidiosa]AAF83301.1 hypothetical protein XF_0491 [Xylella fastidiosa 9a5c]ALQ94134.1 hypothetical protein XFUD_02045 [Xylella fastidiosa]NRP55011.1 hypothetical protein [Xylella fastidiosa]OCA58648.1 hypothetical protein AA93_02045 [Xylella fastidiosa subsp. pauca 11399]